MLRVRMSPSPSQNLERSATPWRRSVHRGGQARTQALLVILVWIGFVTVQGGIGLLLLKAPTQFVLPGLLWNVVPQALVGSLVMWRALRVGRQPLDWKAIALELLLAIAFVALVQEGTRHTARLVIWLFSLTPAPPKMDSVWRYEYWSTLIMSYAILTTAGRWIAAQDALREEESRAAEAEVLRAEAELSALRARLNPHFLFNTLHTLLALVRRDPAAAERGLEQFGQMMQYALRAGGEQGDCVSVADEMRFTRAYLALEALRLGDRLRVSESVDGATLQVRIPALTLQPLVENAIRHGIGPRPSGGTVSIRAVGRGHSVMLEVTDDGVGMAAGAGRPGGQGLELVRRRLDAVFGGAAGMELAAGEAGGVCVRLLVPVTEA